MSVRYTEPMFRVQIVDYVDLDDQALVTIVWRDECRKQVLGLGLI